MSLARRDTERKLAEKGAIQAASAEAARVGPAASEYELQRARLGVDLRRLREIQSIERKIEVKAELLPGYRDWVAGVLAADTGAADDVLLHVLIWSIDVGDFAAAAPLMHYVVRHDLDLPERFERTAPTYIAEEVAEAALKALGQDRDFDLAVLTDLHALVADCDIFDQVRAKLEKAIGLVSLRWAEKFEADGDGPAGARRRGQEMAIGHLKRALELDAGAGVVTRIRAIERDLKREGAGIQPAGAPANDNAAPADPPPAPDTPPPPPADPATGAGAAQE